MLEKKITDEKKISETFSALKTLASEKLTAFLLLNLVCRKKINSKVRMYKVKDRDHFILGELGYKTKNGHLITKIAVISTYVCILSNSNRN